MKKFHRGLLVDGNTVVENPGLQQAWQFDATGNWSNFTTFDPSDVTKTLDQQRLHNRVNEITDIARTVGANWATPTYDRNGNMTGDEKGQQYTYDAWNRLVRVKDSENATLKVYAYDGQRRRISETHGSETKELHCSIQWQMLETRVAGESVSQYVWEPRYVDELLLRDRATTTPGTLDERLWVLQDVNWNVISLVDVTGMVVERYGYTPFGIQAVYSSVYAALSESLYAITVGFQGFWHDVVTGNVYVRNREYSVTLGRPIQADPLGLQPDVNAYRWEGNNPINLLDPSGLSWLSDGWDWIVDAGSIPLIIARETGRGPTHLGAYMTGNNMPFAAELLNHSLRDNPVNKSYPDGSMPSKKIKASPEHTSTFAAISKEICAAGVGPVRGKGTVAFNSDTDLFAAMHNADYEYFGNKSTDGKFSVAIIYKDLYNYESLAFRGESYDYYNKNGYKGKLKGGFFTVVNEIATLEEFVTMIRPFNVSVRVKEAGCCE